MNKKLLFFVLLLLQIGFCKLYANNIQVVSPKVVAVNPDGTAIISFNLFWEHSFRSDVRHSYDAAWVFIKGYHRQKEDWHHVYIDPNSAAHTIENANAVYDIQVAIDNIGGVDKATGLFVYRSEPGSGYNELQDFKIKLNYLENNYTADDTLVLTVFAIEMVHIPSTGGYILGDGQSTKTFYKVGNNLRVASAPTTTKVKDMEKIEGETGLSFEGTPIPDAFPKGTKGFFLMKHEISQHAYADFLNTLTLDQQKKRTSTAPTSAQFTYAFGTTAPTYRNYIRINLPSIDGASASYGHSIDGKTWDREEQGGNIACNFLSWADGLAYLDWACLRPITEMEYEKACRGHKRVNRGEWAWGQNLMRKPMANNVNAIANPGKSNEGPADTTCNYLETGKAPWVMRCGAFARDSTTRIEAGSAYYGAMNMSDNLWERCVNVSTAVGRSFVPNNGDGELTTDGEHNVSGWVDHSGGGLRGFQVSNRQYADLADASRLHTYGFRGGRFVPEGAAHRVGPKNAPQKASAAMAVGVLGAQATAVEPSEALSSSARAQKKAMKAEKRAARRAAKAARKASSEAAANAQTPGVAASTVQPAVAKAASTKAAARQNTQIEK